MDLQTLDQLEARVTELTARYLDLKKGHQKTTEKLAEKENELRSLSVRLEESQQVCSEAKARIDSILKKLEFLRAQSD